MGSLADSQYDIIIVGAGMVGAAAACLLSKENQSAASAPLKIALIETKVAKSFDPEQFDPRVAAITERSRCILASCNSWTAIAELRACAYQAMEVWDAESTGRVSFDCADIHQPNLGHIVESAVIVQVLLQQIRLLDNVDLICPAEIDQYYQDDSMMSVQLADGRHLSCSLLIGADGGHSKVREYFGFECKQWSYNHQAIVATVTTEKPNLRTAWQRFMSTGPLALLPLDLQGDLHKSSLVWSQDVLEAKRLMALDDQQFCAELSQASEQCLGDVLLVDRRFSFPLTQNHATDYVKSRVALVGDAAHTIHPLAGQGVNLGFADIHVLSEEIFRAIDRNLDIGDVRILKRYQRRRQPENIAAMGIMEGFKRLFAADQLPVRLLRSFGMTKFDKIIPLKNQVIKRAMGL